MSDQESPDDLSHFEITRKIESGELITAEKKGKSKAWLVFAEILRRDGKPIQSYVFCKYCKRTFKYCKQTSNLIKHKCFVDLYDQESSVEPDDTKNLTKVMTRWFIKECRSHDLINSKGLRDTCKELIRLSLKLGNDLNVVNLMPSPTDITRNIYRIYKQCFERVQTDINSVKEQGFGLTGAIRTDSLPKQSCIAVTAHYMKKAQLIKNFLGLRINESDTITNQDISRVINQILEDFNCRLSKKSIMVVDSSNPLLKTAPDVNYLPCMSQLLSDALFESMEKVPEVLEIKNNCSDLVNYLIKEGYEAVLVDVADNSYQNSWISIYKTLSSVEKNWPQIEHILLELNEKARVLSINVNRLKAVVKFFQSFEEAIESLENDSCATLHLVIVYLHELKKTCDTDDEFQDFEFIEQLKENLRKSLAHIETEHVTVLHKVALFLYPPTNKLLQFNEEEKKSIEDECRRLMENYKHEVKPNPQPATKSSSDAALSKRRKLFSDFIEPETNDYANEHFGHEIQLYRNTRVVNSPDFDVFNWWQLQKDTFPFLYKLSCTVLATPATSAASKRILFKGKSLNEAKLEKILFVNLNAKSEELEGNFSTLEHNNF